MIHLDPPDFGELRSLLAGEFEIASWDRICVLVERWDRDELAHGVLAYITSHLERWPDRLRLAPTGWVRRKLAGVNVAQWPMVRGLSCAGMVLGHALCERITEDLLSPKVHILSARSAHIGYLEMQSLLDAPTVSNLTALDLTHTPLDNDTMLAIASSQKLERLEELSLGGCKIGNDGLSTLATATNLPALKTLDLQDSRIGLFALKAMGLAPFAAQLRTLDLSDNHLGRHGAQLLTSLPSMRSLERLRLHHCGLAPEGVEALCQDHAFEQLTHLDLERNALRSEGLLTLLDSDILRHVKTLNLGTNKIGDDAIEALAESPHIESLERIILHWNPLTARARDILDARGIKHDLKDEDWEKSGIRI